MAARLTQQLAFLVEIDRLKGVLRQTPLADGSRRENSAEHSWHLALLAMVLAEHSDEPVDVSHVIQLVLAHDLVEIDAGDTFCYDEAGYLDKAEREERAAARLFGLLPPDQAALFHALWQEFEARATAEARFANAVDRMQALLLNMQSGGGSWRTHSIRLEQVQARMAPVADASAPLAARIAALLDEAVTGGLLKT